MINFKLNQQLNLRNLQEKNSQSWMILDFEDGGEGGFTTFKIVKSDYRKLLSV